jgi:esterase/lipase superfamily enzyme
MRRMWRPSSVRWGPVGLLLLLTAGGLGCNALLNMRGEPEKYHRVSVFYGTDRLPTGKSALSEFYGAELGSTQVGTCDVSIPLDHRMGVLESPSFHYFEDPRKHIVLLSIVAKKNDQFFSDLQEQVRRSTRSAAFVFIHGYNVSFEDACRRTGQLAYDLKFPGVPMMWSWPSSGTVSAYISDETRVEWTTPHLREFLSQVKTRSGAEALHIIAHSMGSRAIVRALADVVAELRSGDRPPFSQVVLTAPDIDATLFRQVSASIARGSVRTTLYASSADEAIKVSRRLHGDLPRAGEAGSDLVLVDGIDTVDASAVDTSLLGHSYFADRTSVISDMFDLFLSFKPPQERFYLEAKQRDGRPYWEFRR